MGVEFEFSGEELTTTTMFISFKTAMEKSTGRVGIEISEDMIEDLIRKVLNYPSEDINTSLIEVLKTHAYAGAFLLEIASEAIADLVSNMDKIKREKDSPPY